MSVSYLEHASAKEVTQPVERVGGHWDLCGWRGFPVLEGGVIGSGHAR